MACPWNGLRLQLHILKLVRVTLCFKASVRDDNMGTIILVICRCEIRELVLKNSPKNVNPRGVISPPPVMVIKFSVHLNLPPICNFVIVWLLCKASKKKEVG